MEQRPSAVDHYPDSKEITGLRVPLFLECEVSERVLERLVPHQFGRSRGVLHHDSDCGDRPRVVGQE